MRTRGGFFRHAIQDLPYQDLDQIQSRQQCMVCRMKGEFVQEFMRRTLSTQSPKFATWQPFVITHAELRVGESLTRVYPCLLPGAMLSNGNGAVSYTPVVFELVLRYRGAGCSLDSVGTGSPTPIFLSNLAKWLDNCHEHHGDQCNALAAVVEAVVPSGFRLVDTSVNNSVNNSIVECTG